MTDGIPVRLAGEARHYDILIEAGLLASIGRECRRLLPENARVLLVTDSHLADLHARIVQASLEAAGFKIFTVIVPAGEDSKSLAQAEKIYKTALANGFSRKDAIVALGGGVIGDLAGFCASTFHRGMAVIHVPTTLIAQVDSAIGGKTAVNFGQVKNIVGTFYQPKAVLIDPEALRTLPERERRTGLAEVVKYGLIETSCTGETGFFDWLISHAGDLPAHYPTVIQRSCDIKVSVVMADELETKGLRYFLNLGHTFGHAYESLSRYALLHGEAVAIGLLKAAQLAVRLGQFPEAETRRLRHLLLTLGFEDVLSQSRNYEPDALLSCMRQDKKNTGNFIRLVLPGGKPGTVVIRDDVPDADILQVLHSAF